jgi:16S rRNA (guanine966-N2)-methyltransferase
LGGSPSGFSAGCLSGGKASMPGIRVIGGTARGRKLKMAPGAGTRPISDRAKESLFNLLGSDIESAEVLDLFAGTGSVGIEALSRGAARATFVECDRQAVNTIQANLKTVGFAERGRVLRADVFIYLRNQPKQGFDFIYVAPPQYHNLWAETLAALDARPAWANPDCVVVAQIDPREFQALPLKNLELADQRRYGSTLLCLYERPGT